MKGVETSMKKILLVLLLLVTSCKTEFPTEISTFNVEVQLVRPQAFPNLNIANAIVRLRSLETGRIDTSFTDSLGLAVFYDVRPGRYDIRTRASNRNGVMLDTLMRRAEEAKIRLQLL